MSPFREIELLFENAFTAATVEVANGRITTGQVRSIADKYLYRFDVAHQRQTKITDFIAEEETDPAIEGIEALFG